MDIQSWIIEDLQTDDFPIFPNGIPDRPLTITTHRYGKCVTPHGTWSRECDAVFEAEDIRGINLNLWAGWVHEPIDFVQRLKGIEAIHIFTGAKESLKPLMSSVPSLKLLSLQCRPNKKFDVSLFQRLTNLTAYGDRHLLGLEEAESLYALCLYGGPKFSSLAHFRKLKNLRRLEIIKGGIEELGFDFDRPDLRELKITHCYKFRSLEGLQHAPNLKCLEVVSAKKLEGIEPIKHVAGLQWLTLEKCGGVSDIETVLELKQLEYLNLIDSTSFSDDEYDRLLELPNLDAPAFTPRRHNDWQRTLSLRQKLNKRKLERSGEDWVQQLQSSWRQAK